MSELTIRERKLLADFLKGWKIERVYKKYYWDGDILFPVKHFATINKLISKGLIEEFHNNIRALPLAEEYACQAKFCVNGKIEKYIEEEDDYICEGDCKNCDGIGVLKKRG